jgi:hypothetical protein
MRGETWHRHKGIKYLLSVHDSWNLMHMSSL